MTSKNQIVKSLANHQLIPIHEKWPDYRELVEQEWKWRYGTDYPYRLQGEEILHMEQSPDAVPEHITKQVEDIKEEESKEWHDSVVEQLHLVTGDAREYFQKMSNAQLKEKLKILYG